MKNKLKIIYEDKDIIVIDKKAKLLTVSTSNEKENTLFHQVLTYLKRKNKNNKVFIVHRLDKDTSGIVLFAKSERIKYLLQKKWNEITIRNYIAVVEGNVEKQKDILKSWLKETSTLLTYSSNIKNDGKLAITEYYKIKSNKKYSLLSIRIYTGRKNQIRVQMKDIGHTIVGDKKYGSSVNPINRMCLHANKLELIHPITKKNLIFESKMPKEFNLVD